MNEGNAGSQSLEGVERSFDILEYVVAEGPIGVTELAEAFDLPKSTIHLYLTALNRSGYVVNEDGTYRSSFRLLEQAGIHLQSQPLVAECRDQIHKLAEEYGETTSLVVREDVDSVVIYQGAGQDAVFHSGIGDHAPLNQTAAGKAILAWLPRETVEKIVSERGLPSATGYTITDRSTLFQELEQTYDQGYAYERGEHTINICAVAAPINIDTTTFGAISISGPRERIHQRREEIAQSLLNTTNHIEALMTSK